MGLMKPGRRAPRSQRKAGLDFADFCFSAEGRTCRWLPSIQFFWDGLKIGMVIVLDCLAG